MNIIKNYWRTISLFVIIVFLSLMNVNNVLPNEVSLHRHFDKFAHFSMYLSLSFVFFIENFKSTVQVRKRWIILDTVLLGIALEFTQLMFTSNRSGSFYDAVFNTIGVLSGSILFFCLKNYKFVYKLMLFKKAYNK